MTADRRLALLERFAKYSASFEAHARPQQSRRDSALDCAQSPEGVWLSVRESDVLRLVADGSTNDEIASALMISVETVKSHVRKVLAKLGARNRAESVAIALRAGFIA